MLSIQYRRGVEKIPFLCIKCNSLVHRKCSGIRKCLTKVVCRKCSNFTDSSKFDEEVTINGNVLERVTKFSHLGNVLSSGEGVQEAVDVDGRSSRI